MVHEIKHRYSVSNRRIQHCPICRVANVTAFVNRSAQIGKLIRKLHPTQLPVVSKQHSHSTRRHFSKITAFSDFTRILSSILSLWSNYNRRWRRTSHTLHILLSSFITSYSFLFPIHILSSFYTQSYPFVRILWPILSVIYHFLHISFLDPPVSNYHLISEIKRSSLFLPCSVVPFPLDNQSILILPNPTFLSNWKGRKTNSICLCIFNNWWNEPIDTIGPVWFVMATQCPRDTLVHRTENGESIQLR